MEYKEDAVNFSEYVDSKKKEDNVKTEKESVNGEVLLYQQFQ